MNCNFKGKFKSVAPVYEAFVIPSLESSLFNGMFAPNDAPWWLDYLEFDVKYDDTELYLVDKTNCRTEQLFSGNVLVFNTNLKQVEDIQPDIDEFMEHYFQ